MKKLALNKQTKNNLITYAIVVAAYIIVQILIAAGALSYHLQGMLVSVCTYIIMAISLNLTVGILGELSLGHAGFMCVGAFLGAIFSIAMKDVITLFINKTKAGQAMLAVSEDKGAAKLMGINVDATIALTFAIGSGLAAIAGVLLCSAYPTLNPYTGSMPGIKAFVAAVFGGIGSIPGALIGGLLLGIIEILSKAYISSQLADAIVFGVLIVVLIVKPTGILGKKIQEKV